MRSDKDGLAKELDKYFGKIEGDIAHLYQEHYKSEVAINTIISLLVDRGVFTLNDFKKSMAKIRKKVRES